MKRKIHIIGSCVTRDAFKVLGEDRLVGRYSSRSSLISRLAPPLDFNLPSYLGYGDLNWKQKMIVEDLAKNGLYVDDYADGILIIDFIDEMFKLLKVGNTFVTESTEFMQCELKKVLDVSEILSRGNQQDFDLWTDACYQFTNLIPQQIREKTILHKAFWSQEYIQAGEKYSFEEQAGIDFYNRNLAYYYQTFESIYLPGSIIEISLDKRIADGSHKWGLAPFHYVLEYYEEFYRQVIEFGKSASD